MAEFVRHEPCPACGSRDNLARYSDGSGFCFGCKHHEKEAGEVTQAPTTTTKPAALLSGEYLPLEARGISEETCRKYGYMVGKHNNATVHIASYRRDGKVVAQKIRTKDKKFRVLGDGKDLPFFGQHLWNDSAGKRLVVTEGEIDALTISQLQSNKWPVVSVPNGAQGAAKTFAAQIEFLEQFEEVVIAFDMDDPGQAAAIECAAVLSPGKAKIAHLPAKDANAALLEGKGKEVVSALWEAKPYRPDGLVSIDDIMDDAERPVERGRPWCFDSLTALTYGRRPGEVYAIGAGTGIGKTDFMTQQAMYDITVLGEHVGVIYLEAKPVDTAKRIAGKLAGRRFHIPDAGWTVAEQREALSALKGKVTFYDNFGETEWDVVRGKIRYMAKSLGIRHIFLDHLTAMADTANEKESLEQMMKEMAGLANELGLIIHFVSHLSTPDGKPHEEGGRVMIRHFKGSRAIGFWSHYMLGLERDQQAEDEETRKVTTVRVLKDRYTGQATGKRFGLTYDETTGRLMECPLPEEGGSPFKAKGSLPPPTGDF